MSAQRDLNENKGYDDLDELDYEDGRYGSSRFMRMLSIGFVVAAVGGFCTLAWYAYKSGQEPVNESDIPVVEADMSPVKEKPENPGGWQFQHQDKSVYNQLAAGEGTAPEPVAERVVPKPEEPVTLEKTASNNAAANKNQNVAQEFKKEPIGNLAPASGAVKIEAPKPEKEAQTATLTPVPSIASEEVSEPEVSVKSKPKELKPVEPSKPKVKQEVKTQELKA